jgi:hypothetical protein
MKSILTIFGIILILAGIAGLAYGGINYTTREEIAQIGDVKVTADTNKRVNLPPIAGGACLVVGLALVYLSRKQ